MDSYSQFLPLCTHSKIIRHSADGRSFDGMLTVGLPPLFSEEYISRVQVIPERLTIESQSIKSKNNTFDSLRSRWTLKEIELSDEICCDVDFEVEMTVSDPFIVQVLDKVLEHAAGRQVEAFEKRCHQIPMSRDLLIAANSFKQ